MHRTLRDKFLYMAVYKCELCGERSNYPHGYLWYLARETRCPRCGTAKLKRLAAPDGIDRMIWNLVRPFRLLFPTRLYHCRYCRIQFYDVERSGAPEPTSTARRGA